MKVDTDADKIVNKYGIPYLEGVIKCYLYFKPLSKRLLFISVNSLN